MKKANIEAAEIEDCVNVINLSRIVAFKYYCLFKIYFVYTDASFLLSVGDEQSTRSLTIVKQ